MRFHRYTFLGVLALSVAGCVTTPTTSSPALTLTEPPAVVAARCRQNLAKQGGTFAPHGSPAGEVFQIHFNGNTIVTISVEPIAGGSRVEASCKVAALSLRSLGGSCDPATYLRACRQAGQEGL
jgi:hypothetical protein